MVIINDGDDHTNDNHRNRLQRITNENDNLISMRMNTR